MRAFKMMLIIAFHQGDAAKIQGGLGFYISHDRKPFAGGNRLVSLSRMECFFVEGPKEESERTLIEENLIHTAIGLPANLFFGTGIPSALLIFHKNKKKRNIFFIDASREFEEGKNQNKLRQEDIKKIIDAYKKRKNMDKYTYLASLKEVKENEYNLNIPRYVDTFEEEEEIDIKAVQKEIEGLEKELTAVRKKMNKHLKELY